MPNEDIPAGLKGDVNGDGLADVISISDDGPAVVKVHFSTGHGFSPGPQATIDAAGSPQYGRALALKDLNGDGRLELIVKKASEPQTYFAVVIGDNAITPFPSWAVTLPPDDEEFFGDGVIGLAGDVNGDGLDDFLRTRSGRFSLADGPVDNLLTTARNGYGAEVSLEYKPSSHWDNKRMASVEPTVSAVTVDDGRGATARTEYRYSGGKYDFPERRFLGFATETVLRPCVDDVCPTIARELSQKFASIGAVLKETVRKGREETSPTLREILRDFTGSSDAVPYTALLTDETVYHYRAPGTATGPEYVTTRKMWTYDPYGNMTVEQDYGRRGVNGDERMRAINYYPNTNAYIVSLKGLDRVYAGLSTADAVLARSFYVYDGATVYTTPPERGKLKTRIVSTGTGASADESFGHDQWGNVTSRTDPMGARTEWEFDAAYNLYPVKQTNALGHVGRTTWMFPCGAPAVVTDINGFQTQFSYDDLCRKLLVSRPASGAFEAFDYQSFGDPAAQHVTTRRPHPNGGAQIFRKAFFDGLGRVWREEATGLADAQPIVVTRDFDRRGNLISQSLPRYEGGAVQNTLFSHDGLDRVDRRQNPDGTARRFRYDVDDRYNANDWAAVGKVTATDELGRDTVAVSDAWGRPLEITRFLSGDPVVEKRRYDRLGRLTKVVDPRGSEWNYTYDLRGLRLTAADPDLGAWSYSYDLNGRLKQQTDARSLTATLGYDALGRLMEQRAPRPGGALADIVTNTYDVDRDGFLGKGRLTRAVAKLETNGVLSTVAAVAYDYDSEGRPAREKWTVDGQDYWKTARYAAGGEILWRTFPRGGVEAGEPVGSAASTWRYDAAGRLLSIPGVLDSADYRADGLRREARYPNGVVSTFAYDGQRLWLDGIEVRKGAATLFRTDYTRDDLGRIKFITSDGTAENWEYRYDALDRLTYADNLDNANAAQTFGYDSAGNMLSNSKLGSYTYVGPGEPRPHAPRTAGSRVYTYDLNGNAWSDGTRGYRWDGLNRLLSVGPGGSGLASFVYGPDGRRLKKLTPSGTTLYLGADYELSNGVATRYLSADAVRVGPEGSGGTTSWLSRDHLGSVRVRTSATGAVLETLRYEACGAQPPPRGSRAASSARSTMPRPARSTSTPGPTTRPSAASSPPTAGTRPGRGWARTAMRMRGMTRSTTPIQAGMNRRTATPAAASPPDTPPPKLLRMPASAGEAGPGTAPMRAPELRRAEATRLPLRRLTTSTATITARPRSSSATSRCMVPLRMR